MEREDDPHWIEFKNSELIVEDGGKFYLTVTINLDEDEVEVFSMGEKICENKCNTGYFDTKTICDSSIPFTVGVEVSGNPLKVRYSSFKLYGCRLYDRVLSESEIEQNYNESKNLLNS